MNDHAANVTKNPDNHHNSAEEADRMDIKRLAIGTLVGGIVLYGAGVLIFDMAFS